MPLVARGYFAGAEGSSALSLRSVLAALVMLPATVFMGASFPAIVRAVERRADFAASWALLYGSNTAGAVFGSKNGEAAVERVVVDEEREVMRLVVVGCHHVDGDAVPELDADEVPDAYAVGEAEHRASVDPAGLRPHGEEHRGARI